MNELTFKQEVLGASVPVLVNVWAPWCGACRLIDPLLRDLQTSWGGQVKLVRLNADDNLKLVAAYKVTNLPTVMLFDQGSPICRLEQFRHREDFHQATTELHAAIESVMLRHSYTASA